MVASSNFPWAKAGPDGTIPPTIPGEIVKEHAPARGYQDVLAPLRSLRGCFAEDVVAIEVRRASGEKASDLVFDAEVAVVPNIYVDEVLPELLSRFDPEPLLQGLREEAGLELENLPEVWRQRVLALLPALRGALDEAFSTVEGWSNPESPPDSWTSEFLSLPLSPDVKESGGWAKASWFWPLDDGDKPGRWRTLDWKNTWYQDFDADELVITPWGGDLELAQRWESCGKVNLRAVTPAVVVEGARFTRRYGDFAEFSVSNSMRNGVDWKATIRNSDQVLDPSASGTLTLGYSFRGSFQPEFSEEGIKWLTDEGECWITTNVTVEDAEGRPLDARYEPGKGDSSYSLVINITDAKFPLTIK
jgi:hypothetical protein